MHSTVILSVIGADRPGLTEALAVAVQAAGGNWLESRLTRLGGSYVGSVLVELPADALEILRDKAAHVDAAGLKVTIAAASQAEPPAGTPLGLSLVGQDRPGIVKEVSAALARLGVNIEELETGTEAEAWSGNQLFRATLALRVPAGISAAAVQDALEAISGEIMVDFTVVSPPAA
jgi:glycine cleavage system regulatory protein